MAANIDVSVQKLFIYAYSECVRVPHTSETFSYSDAFCGTAGAGLSATDLDLCWSVRFNELFYINFLQSCVQCQSDVISLRTDCTRMLMQS